MKHVLAPSSLALLLAMSAAASAEVVGTPGVPSGFGLAGNVWAFSLSGSYGPERNPPDDTERTDGSGSLLLGFGNPATAVGVQTGLVLTSFRDFGESGYLTAGVHRLFQFNEFGVGSIAANVSYIAPWGDAEDLDVGGQVIGSYLTSVGGRLALFSLGAANDTNDDRDVEAILGAGFGVSPTMGLSLGQVGERTSAGMALAPRALGGGTLGISVSHDWDSNDNTLTIDFGRAFNLFRS